jgi:hypothetical protein
VSFVTEEFLDPQLTGYLFRDQPNGSKTGLFILQGHQMVIVTFLFKFVLLGIQLHTLPGIRVKAKRFWELEEEEKNITLLIGLGKTEQNYLYTWCTLRQVFIVHYSSFHFYQIFGWVGTWQ